MSFYFGQRSLSNLETCHTRLQKVMSQTIIITPYDFMIICGWRGEAEQTEWFETGKSKKRWPDSEHNKISATGQPESLAVDFIPYIAGKPVDWEDTHIFAAIAGAMMASAISIGELLRWGGDWDGDGSTRDQRLMDWGHVELVLL